METWAVDGVPLANGERFPRIGLPERRKGLRLVVHDYSGHPFQVQLSRELARRGNEVHHFHFAGFQTPKGALEVRAADPPTFRVEGLDLEAAFAKYSLIRRWRQEIAYGRLASQRTTQLRPDVVVSANMPLDAQKILLESCRSAGIRFVFWVQDLYSVAIQQILQDKYPLVGSVIGRVYRQLERRLLIHSDDVICITPDFVPIIRRWGVDGDRCHVIENWAPLDEIVPSQKDNDWAREHDLHDKCVLMYCGTLGFKHDPSFFIRLAEHFRTWRDVRVVVVSEGPGADVLRSAKETERLENLVTLPFQAFERFSEVLAAADVLFATLEHRAGSFSVPSKVLSYLCAARPVILVAPAENRAALTLREAGAGYVVRPGDFEDVREVAERLVRDPALRAACGRSGRAYAARRFDIEAIGDRFESIWRRQTRV